MSSPSRIAPTAAIRSRISSLVGVADPGDAELGAKRANSEGRNTRVFSPLSRPITAPAWILVMATTRSTSRSSLWRRRLTWSPMSKPISAMTATACGVAGRCDHPSVPAEATDAVTPAAPSRPLSIASPIGDRHVLPVQTTNTRNSHIRPASHAPERDFKTASPDVSCREYPAVPHPALPASP